jgi:hypothetical protein
MTEGALQKLIDKWVPRLGLDQWLIELRVEDTEDKTSYMEVNRSTTYERAVLFVPPWLLNGGPTPESVLEITITDPFIERSLVHELLHLQLRDMRNVTDEPLEGVLHRDVHRMVDDQMRRVEEQTVDRLAAALVRTWA